MGTLLPGQLNLFQQENLIMKTITTTAAALVISALSFSAFAAQSAQSTNHITSIEAGSNMIPGTHVVKGTNDAAFNAHTLVAGGWE